MKKILFNVLLLSFVTALHAQNSHQLWLRKKAAVPVNVISTNKSATVSMATKELQEGWQGTSGASVTLSIKKDKSIKYDGFRLTASGVEANTESGILYGAFELLRRQQTGQIISEALCNPSYEIRILNHWDNLNGSIERGYAGPSIFWHKDSSLEVTNADKTIWNEYARANASVGINAAVLNNVNASPSMLSAPYLKRVQAIAEVLRPYGIKTYLSIKFS